MQPNNMSYKRAYSYTYTESMPLLSVLSNTLQDLKVEVKNSKESLPGWYAESE